MEQQPKGCLWHKGLESVLTTQALGLAGAVAHNSAQKQTELYTFAQCHTNRVMLG